MLKIPAGKISGMLVLERAELADFHIDKGILLDEQVPIYALTAEKMIRSVPDSETNQVGRTI